MRYKSTLVAVGSGSIGGTTFSHNAGGAYIRNRTTPTDPSTNAQQSIRGIVASLVNLWVDTLTAIQRAAWDTYAGNVPLNDVFGDPRFRTGLNHYVRSNVPRMQVGKGRIDAAPTVFDLGEYTNPGLTITSATNKFNITFGDTDDWVSEDDSCMLLWGSQPKNPSINFFKGPWKAMNPISGNSITPETSPYEVGVPYPYVTGQKGFMRARVSRADGRLSPPFLIGVVAT